MANTSEQGVSSPPFGSPSILFEPRHNSNKATSGLRFLVLTSVQQRPQEHCNPCISRAGEMLKCRTATERKIQRAQFSLWEMKETKDTSSSLDFWCKEAQKRTPANNESRVPLCLPIIYFKKQRMIRTKSVED